MKLLGFACVAGLICTAAQGQLEIRQNSVAAVTYYAPGTNQHTSVTDTINATSGFELVSRQQFVSYDDPTLDYDPSASSMFSVDAIEVMQDLGSRYLIRVDISGVFFRKGPGISLYFDSANVMSSVEVEFDIAFLQADWSANYVTTQSNLGLFDSFPASVSQVDPFELRLLELDIDGLSNNVTGSASSIGGRSTTARIDAMPDLSQVLIPHDGETTLQYSVSLYGLVSDIPAPGTVALPAAAGLFMARRRRAD